MTRVTWKDEDEVDGVPVGPVRVWEDGEGLSRPFDPDREPDPWVTAAEAEAIAAEHGVQLERS